MTTEPTPGSARAAAELCPFCQGTHDWPDCPVVYTPIKDCEFKDSEDGCCSHPKNMTPECHVNACPRLNAKLVNESNSLPAIRSAAEKALAALEEIGTAAHCISLSGPATTPDLATAWSKFDRLSSMATKALADLRTALNGQTK